MLRFKKYIIEKELPKNVTLSDVRLGNHSDADNLPNLSFKEIIFWTQYINKLKVWTDGEKEGPALKSYKNKIPKKFRKGGMLYRAIGFPVSGFGFNELLEIIKNKKIKPREVESWSRNKKAAEFFLKRKSLGIIISKNISDNNVILDVKKFVNDPEIIKIGAKVTLDNFDKNALLNSNVESEVIVSLNKPIKLDDNIEYVKFNKQITNLEEFTKEINKLGKK